MLEMIEIFSFYLMDFCIEIDDWNRIEEGNVDGIVKMMIRGGFMWRLLKHPYRNGKSNCSLYSLSIVFNSLECYSIINVIDWM